MAFERNSRAAESVKGAGKKSVRFEESKFNTLTKSIVTNRDRMDHNRD
jgi:hypothetical protein